MSDQESEAFEALYNEAREGLEALKAEIEDACSDALDVLGQLCDMADDGGTLDGGEVKGLANYAYSRIGGLYEEC